MLDWDMQTNAVELIGGAVIQVSVVVITALLTWFITHRSDRARARAEEAREYEYQIDRYYEDLVEVLSMLEEMAMDHESGFTRDQLRRYERFINRVRWKPKPEHLVVDVWVRTELSRIPNHLQTVGEQESWDEWDEHQIRKRIHDVGRRFLLWVNNREHESSFREELEMNGMRSTSYRFDDPLETPRTRATRIVDALKASRQLVVRAWKGNPAA
jgi:hypothetical protein